MNNNIIRNVLNTSTYLFKTELQESIDKSIPATTTTYLGSKNPLGVYLVMFRVLNLKTNVLVYNYIYYPRFFFLTLLTYLTSREEDIPNAVVREWGDFLSIFDINLHENLQYHDKLKLNLINKRGEELLYAIDKSDYLATDLHSTLNLINKLYYTVDYNSMFNIISLACKKDYMGFVKEILGSIKDYDILSNKISNFELDKSINMINPCLFVVKDLDKFISNLTDKGLKVNCGPQPLRGKMNSINNFLNCLDTDYRKALYNHNSYHVRTGNIDSKFLLHRSKFSFRNIHMNIGNVHYYSTNSKSSNINLNNINLKPGNKQTLTNSIFDTLKTFIENNPVNSETQKKIESFIQSQYNWWNSGKASYSILDINTDIFTPKFSAILMEKRDLIYSYLSKLKNNKNIIKIKSEDPLSNKNHIYYLNKVIQTLDVDRIMNLILYNFFKLVSYSDSEFENINELRFAIDFGKNISREYMSKLYKEYKKSNEVVSFTDWKLNVGLDIVSVFEDNSKLYDFLGTRLFVELLIQADLIHEEIIINRTEKNRQFKILSLNKNILELFGNNRIHVVPLKLPMIVEPKPYTSKELGGFLLNGVENTESLLIDKANYKESSTIKENIIYSMVNNMSKTPYRVNKEVLDFIQIHGIKYGLIEDVTKYHEFEFIKRTKRQDTVYRSYRSKLILEKNILGVANTYLNVSMYFPLRLDQRGRIYCEPLYFNYQSTELAKALISFAKPGIIHRKDKLTIDYLKSYGANCYGNGLDKKSYSKRVDWFNKNIEDVLDYKNGILLTKAKNKCLFLAFCMEYVRFTHFLEQDSLEFQTYLPIQLDATCNGFQHLALLSNETKMFKELNISKTSKKDDPKDFYTFMINALNIMFKDKSESLDVTDDDRESYLRLIAFPWNRKYIKYAIMTWPYNATLTTIVKYIKDTLKVCDFTEEEYEIVKNNINYKKNKQTELITNVVHWYGLPTQSIPKRLLNDRDIFLLGNAIKDIITKYFPKIIKLSDYLLNVASICASLGIPITWSLPNGLHIKQSYLATKTATIKPFTFIKSSFKLRITDKNNFDISKQKTALMPNLIHSLDSTSLSLLYDRFFYSHKPFVNFYAIHDCFTTTCDKVESLINLLKIVYLNLYTEDTYLRKFDKGIIDSIIYNYAKDCVYDSRNRTFKIENKYYKLYDIEQVLGKNLPSKDTSDLIKQSEYLII
jgi:DNA-directed RNA polymerase